MDEVETARRATAPTEDPLTLVRRRLLRQSFVFDDPAAYAAGVEDAIEAVRHLALLGDRSAGRGTRTPVRAVPRAEESSTTATDVRGAAG